MLARQVVYQIRTFCRTPIAVFFTIALPLIMLVLFNALFGDNEVDTGSGSWPLSQFYTGGLAAFTAVSATFTNLANIVPIRRDEGVLKRWRGTPLPPWVYLGGLVGSAIVLAAAGVVITLTLGVVAYDLDIEAAKMPAAIVTFLVGVAAFAALGHGRRRAVPVGVGGVGRGQRDHPADGVRLGDLHPPRGPAGVAGDARRRAAAEAVRRELPGRLQPGRRAAGVRLGRPGAWSPRGASPGCVVALRWFKWEPSRGGSTPRRRARMAAAEQA